jgi:hypothetical protein
MANRILLTGAGFTHNFGAPLASEVSNLIFNLVATLQLKNLLRNNFDYEDIYQKVLQSNDYSISIKNELTKAITEAYQQIDKQISIESLSEKINLIRFKEFINCFNKNRDAGYIFTLNQDLLIENNINNNTFYDLHITIPLEAKTNQENTAITIYEI